MAPINLFQVLVCVISNLILQQSFLAHEYIAIICQWDSL